jgi:uncharacterized protein YndB with AHSA1/START domain
VALAERSAVVRRTLPVSPALVYAEWTDPDAIADWMCPRPARCLSVILEPRVGGALRFEIEENGVTFSVWGRFLSLVAPRLIRFTWSCSTWPDPGVESMVTVTLDEVGDDETVMTIEHSGLPDGLAERHEAGWFAIAEQLASELAAGA